ncbi:MAG: NAD(P)/FAD-dependent oxidoreductase, partial [Planctomycetota bacterium]
LIGAEDELPYYRLNLTRYLAGAQDRAALHLHPRSWYDERGIALRLGTPVSSIDAADKQLRFADDETLAWDRLVLAAGAHPFVPPIPGNELAGVHCIRTIADVEAVRERCDAATRCVCIGGGILGMEVAAALAAQGAQVELLESHGWLMPRQLDRRAGALLQEHAAGMGITTINAARVAEIRGSQEVREVVLADGASHPADLVTLTTGVRPNTHLARRIGLDVRRGVVVDNHMRSSQPDIYAAGDIAEHAGTVYGLWTPAQSMGAIAGMNAAGAAAEFGGIPRSNTVKVIGADVFSIGTIEPEDGSYRVIAGEDGGVYRRFVVRDGCLVGAVLFGASELAAAVRIAVEEGLDVAPALSKEDAGELAAFLAERA